ncbi:DUF1573 domain-containing protein [Flavobacterium sp.]|jgi:hypothetical protein|uniref:DUF1573 domain-containing protein n=1 Tax=Flavobacterium sp. TaxID=239 RepID=UPI0037C17A22
MKNKFIVAFLIATLIASCAKKNQEFAELTFTNEINFGKIKVNDTVNKKFKLKNTSNTILKIKDIKTSCGCTVAKLKDSVVNPNDYAEIDVEYISDKDDVGNISKSIIVDANTKPNFTVLYLKGKVE